MYADFEKLLVAFCDPLYVCMSFCLSVFLFVFLYVFLSVCSTIILKTSWPIFTKNPVSEGIEDSENWKEGEAMVVKHVFRPPVKLPKVNKSFQSHRHIKNHPKTLVLLHLVWCHLGCHSIYTGCRDCDCVSFHS